MQSIAETNRPTFWQLMNEWLFFAPSEKLKFSIKVSLSLVFAYLIPFYMGWPQASTAAITIMLIATMGAVGDSIQKGFVRIIGTLIGGITGLSLIALFPQDRALYLISLSLFLTLFLYLYRAYKGDGTVFMLSGMMMMMVFQGGNVEGSFIYGVDRIFMTVFGIVVYTIVSVFLWPVRVQDNRIENARNLSSKQRDLFLARTDDPDQKNTSLQALHKAQEALQKSSFSTNDESGSMSMSSDQWSNIIYTYGTIGKILTLISHHCDVAFRDEIPKYVEGYERLEREVSMLFESLQRVWQEKKEFEVPPEFELVYDKSRLSGMDHLKRARLTTTVEEMSRLHRELRKLSFEINQAASMKPALFTPGEMPASSAFNWFDIDDIKATFVSILIYWTSVAFWIYFNPPAGFLIVTMATLLSLLTVNSPLKPSLLIILFSFSFIFSISMYVAILPHLHYSWELGIFIFMYGFIAFYMINPEVSIFFLLGMFLLMLNNEMNYNFDLFLLILFVFYLFLFILLFFYYIPFSTKPEDLFLKLEKRFFTYMKAILSDQRERNRGKSTLIGRLEAKYAHYHLLPTVKKMQLWGSKIDTKYFDLLDVKKLMEFTKECEDLAYMVNIMYQYDQKSSGNSLIKDIKNRYNIPKIGELLDGGLNPGQSDSIEKMMAEIQLSLERLLSEIRFDDYKDREIVELYEFINIRSDIWYLVFSLKDKIREINTGDLAKGRF